MFFFIYETITFAGSRIKKQFKPLFIHSKFVSSKIKEPNVVNKNKGNFNAIHDLTVASKDKSWGEDSKKFNLSRMSNYQKYMTPKGKCPFYNTKENAKVPCEFSIYERDN